MSVPCQLDVMRWKSNRFGLRASAVRLRPGPPTEKPLTLEVARKPERTPKASKSAEARPPKPEAQFLLRLRLRRRGRRLPLGRFRGGGLRGSRRGGGPRLRRGLFLHHRLLHWLVIIHDSLFWRRGRDGCLRRFQI